jgi:DNA polymerase III beta subunit-like protein
MKFSVSKDKLLEGLSTVQNVVNTRTTFPILSNVLLQASDGEIRLSDRENLRVFKTRQSQKNLHGIQHVGPHKEPYLAHRPPPGILQPSDAEPTLSVHQSSHQSGLSIFGSSRLMIID